MTVLVFLTLFLILSAVLVFRKSAVYMVTGTFTNFLLFILLLFLLGQGLPVYLMTILIFLSVTIVTLFYINGVNQKTKIAFFCVVLFLFLFMVITIPFIQIFKVHGFALEELDELATMDFSVKVPFSALNTSIILMSLSGAVIDSSMAVSSSTYEIYQQSGQLSFKELLQSSQKIVHEILSSTINTLLFAFMGSSLALVIWLQDLNYSFAEVVNSKAFVGEILISFLTGMAAVIVLPVTSVIASYFFVNKNFEINKKIKERKK